MSDGRLMRAFAYLMDRWGARLKKCKRPGRLSVADDLMCQKSVADISGSVAIILRSAAGPVLLGGGFD